jgi:hypothetical protein
MTRRKWIGVATVLACGGGVAAYEILHGRPTLPSQASSITPTTTAFETTQTSVTTQQTSPISAPTLTDYLRSKGVQEHVADLASSYGNLDANKKELGDLTVRITEFADSDRAEEYQRSLLTALTAEDPDDVSAERLDTVRYMFSDKSLLINMLAFSMYPGVFDYLETAKSKYPDVDKRVVYATVGIPRFQKVSENGETFDAIMERATDPQYGTAFDQMLSEGNVDKSKLPDYLRDRFTAICTPIESLVWELLDDDKRADGFLKDYDMKKLVAHAFRTTRASSAHRSEEWDSYDTAANRLGFNSWINWRWMKDNMRYDSKYAEGYGDDRSPEEIYKTKAGVCRHGAYFALHNLERGAIPVALLAVHLKSPNLSTVGNNDWHAFDVERKSDGFWMIEDLGFPCGMFECSPEGPFQDLNQLVRKVANEGKASVLSWQIESTTDVW